MTTRMPKVCYDFIRDVERRATDAGVKFVINKKQPYVKSYGMKVNGYFDDDNLILAVGRGNRPYEEWFATFVHESCHMDQWIEGDPVWTASELDKDNEVDSWMILGQWLDGWLELNAKQRNDYTRRQFSIEQNCEQRSVKRIKEWDLPLDVELYAQKSNAYLYFYKMLGLTRKWYTIGKEPYNVPAIVKLMPTEIIEWDAPLGPKLKQLFRKIVK